MTRTIEIRRVTMPASMTVSRRVSYWAEYVNGNYTGRISKKSLEYNLRKTARYYRVKVEEIEVVRKIAHIDPMRGVWG